MTIQEFLPRLKRIRKSGDGYSAQCPAHQDRNNSLSVGEGDDRKILIHCHAGCTVEAVLTALGLSMRDLFTDDGTAESNHTRLTVEELARVKKLPVGFLRSLGLVNQSDGVRIPYKVEDGSLAKRHHVRRALSHDDDHWCYWTGSRGQMIVPYGEWRLGEARKAGYLVLLEGESDPWTLWYHGFPALGIPGARMTKHLQAEHLRHIPKVFIHQDADGSGSTFVRDIMHRLKECEWSGEARIVLSYPWKDPSEIHCADPAKFKDAFRRALDSGQDAAKWQPTKAASIWDAATFVSAEDHDEPIEFLEEPVLARGAITMIAGPRGLGKSNYARWLAVKLARAGMRVLYLDRDNPPRMAREALRDWGGTGIVKLLTRDQIPNLLGNHSDWKAFPIRDYDVVILDSWDSTAEGAGEKDSRLPSIAMSHILDIAHAEHGPGVLVLMNVVRDGTHSRCNGIVEDRADAVWEVRDLTGFTPSGPKPWWEEMPIVGAKDWATRASRRRERDRIRMGVVPSKYKLGGSISSFGVRRIR